IGWINDQRTDRVRRKAARHELPTWPAAGKRIGGPPYAAARSRNPKPATAGAAVGVNRERSDATGGGVLFSAERQDIRKVRRARPISDQVPTGACPAVLR